MDISQTEIRTGSQTEISDKDRRNERQNPIFTLTSIMTLPLTTDRRRRPSVCHKLPSCILMSVRHVCSIIARICMTFSDLVILRVIRKRDHKLGTFYNFCSEIKSQYV